MRKWCTGRRPGHFFRPAAGVLTALALLAPAPALARKPVPPAAPAAVPVPARSVADFYHSRSDSPLWLAPAAADAAQQLLAKLASSSVDGVAPDRFNIPALQAALNEARKGDRKAILRADQMLSDAFVAYVSEMKRGAGTGTIYVDPQLRPAPSSPFVTLLQAQAAQSLPAYVRTMGWMHPIYGQLRQALLASNYSSDHEKELLQLNLERARALPATRVKYVIVNAAEQRLYMYENGQAVDSMRVVVGKPKYPTPVMTAYIRFAALNPYWYVPPDLASERIAPNVVKRGLKYLDELGYQVLSDWSPNAAVIDPKTIDWKAVAAGKVEVLIRQDPGPHNSMGRMKFMFPNEAGVYLHDNPERELFEQAARLYSGGCVRLEDAARLGRWMFGHDLVWEGAGTEERVPLTTPVPVYITYLTAMPEGASIAYFDDVYGRDKARMAEIQGGSPPPVATGK